MLHVSGKALRRYSETSIFDETSVPKSLQERHQTKAGVWGKLCVHSGTINYVIDGPHAVTLLIEEDQSAIIEPGVIHHVEINGPARFQVEFYR